MNAILIYGIWTPIYVTIPILSYSVDTNMAISALRITHINIIAHEILTDFPQRDPLLAIILQKN